AEDDVAAGRAQGQRHLLIRGSVLSALVDLVAAAPVVFQVVDAPLGPSLGILCFVPVAGFISGAGPGTGSGIDAELEALGVDIVGQGFHVGEFFVGEDVAVFIAAGHPGAFDHAALLPGVVDVDVDVAGLAHAGGSDGVGHPADGRVIDATGELVPTVPTHGRGLGEAVGRDGLESREGRVWVGGVKDRVYADLLEDHGCGRAATAGAPTALSATAATRRGDGFIERRLLRAGDASRLRREGCLRSAAATGALLVHYRGESQLIAFEGARVVGEARSGGAVIIGGLERNLAAVDGAVDDVEDLLRGGVGAGELGAVYLEDEGV